MHSTGQKFSKIISDLLMKNKDLDIDSFERSFIEEMEVEERGNQLGMLVYDRANQVLNMINFDTEISEDSLLIGATSKSLHHQSIGQFGKLKWRCIHGRVNVMQLSCDLLQVRA